MITYLKENFEYKDGKLLRKIGKKKTGTISRGYVRISIDNKLYMEHRLVWLYHYGTMPKTLDHINGDKTDNRIENLRECTQGENRANSKLRKDNKLGIKNVSHNGYSYYARVKKVRYGPFDDPELADLVAVEARTLHYGEYARHA